MALTTASYDIGQKLFSGAASELVNFISLQGTDGQVFVQIPDRRYSTAYKSRVFFSKWIWRQ